MIQDKHTVIDLETLSTRPTAAIIAIGCVYMSLKDGIIRKNHWVIHQDDWCLPGFHVEGKAIAWWMDQHEASHYIIDPKPDEVSGLVGALGQFMVNFDRDSWIWSRGSHFDIPILENALHHYSLPIPWDHRNVWCQRQLEKRYPEFRSCGPDFRGVAHHALDDALKAAYNIRATLNEVPIQN